MDGTRSDTPMPDGTAPRTSHDCLVWITRHLAVNPAAIVAVFHGTHGEVEVVLVAGNTHRLREPELTAAGRALLLPPAEAVAAGAGASHRRDAGDQPRAAVATRPAPAGPGDG